MKLKKNASMYALSLIVFVVIGIIPNAVGGYSCFDWEWWAACSPLWVGVWLRDYARDNYEKSLIG